MVDPDLVLAPSAFGDERPPLPLAIHRRLVPALSFPPPVSARHAGTSRPVL